MAHGRAACWRLARIRHYALAGHGAAARKRCRRRGAAAAAGGGMRSGTCHAGHFAKPAGGQHACQPVIPPAVIDIGSEEVAYTVKDILKTQSAVWRKNTYVRG
ncbi:hypothetical protein NPIL_37021 [Nephila pilipes]|uniref:Uncharacterized protein n=1 Tax=Nephila pilipes TaxID=299642 RepID=A0A8X6QEL4_NEPPI|nr:hypothetical protein NPIL_37021 [Nephila pilipes]